MLIDLPDCEQLISPPGSYRDDLGRKFLFCFVHGKGLSTMITGR